MHSRRRSIWNWCSSDKSRIRFSNSIILPAVLSIRVSNSVMAIVVFPKRDVSRIAAGSLLGVVVVPSGHTCHTSNPKFTIDNATAMLTMLLLLMPARTFCPNSRTKRGHIKRQRVALALFSTSRIRNPPTWIQSLISETAKRMIVALPGDVAIPEGHKPPAAPCGDILAWMKQLQVMLQCRQQDPTHS